MVFLPVPVDASEIILDAGQLWIEHPRATQQVEDGALGFVHLQDKLCRELQRLVVFAVSSERSCSSNTRSVKTARSSNSATMPFLERKTA